MLGLRHTISGVSNPEIYEAAEGGLPLTPSARPRSEQVIHSRPRIRAREPFRPTNPPCSLLMQIAELPRDDMRHTRLAQD